MKYLLAFLMILTFTSCATYQPGKPRKITTTKQVNKDIETVFKNANMWLLENNFNVSFKDKSPYQIIADGDISKLSGLKFDSWSGMDVSNAVADCGTSGILTFYPTQAKVTLIFDTIEESTKVTCKVSFSKFNPEPNPSVAGIIRCESTGVVESGLFSYLDGK